MKNYGKKHDRLEIPSCDMHRVNSLTLHSMNAWHNALCF